ncbi:MATE family efflux transporter [Jeotgalibaca arthritidis]|uniref:Polysaccharide biosynthesis protein n=1 Tax=Jeotgalibaca arthritidis TaxID=1868794 RepID=A0A6G7KB22_9LACT|nr:polysaccharide biosynthesis protein [Jeotgalibaca arthritidis]QII82450.1 polysaccharide biosynthesis protein [Jeotgalibaca arthritidis]
METLKSIFRVASANIFSLGSSFILGFILPIYISTFDYGKYKEFTLYLTFIYIFNIGFNDGIYIKYGGSNKFDLNLSELNSEVKFIKTFQTVMFVAVLAFALLKQDIVLLYFSIATFLMNLIQFHKNLLQAIGEFKDYSKLNMYNTIFNVLMMIIAIFLVSRNDYSVYIFAHVFALLLAYIFYEINFRKTFNFKKEKVRKLSAEDIYHLFKVGIVILLSNMIVTFIANIGSWFVNFGFSTEEFAQYSFSTSLLNIILLVVNAISLVFYNLIAKKEDQEMLINLKKILLLIGCFGGLGFFVFSFIITNYISKYVPALAILSITFISIPYIMESNVIFNNIYKTRNNKKQYLKDMLVFLAIAITLIAITSSISSKMEHIAMATTLSYLIWYFIVTNFKYRYLRDGIKESIFILSHIIIFYICANLLSLPIGFISYFLYVCVILLLYKKELSEMVSKYMRQA